MISSQGNQGIFWNSLVIALVINRCIETFSICFDDLIDVFGDEGSG